MIAMLLATAAGASGPGPISKETISIKVSVRPKISIKPISKGLVVTANGQPVITRREGRVIIVVPQ